MTDPPDSVIPFKPVRGRRTREPDVSPDQCHAPGQILQFPKLALRARSQAEAEIYMWLHPCSCGDRSAPQYASCKTLPASMLVTYKGECLTCGWFHNIVFELPPFGVKPKGGDYGGSEPSRIIDPGEWLFVSDWALDCLLNQPELVIRAPLYTPLRAIGLVVRALAEVLKFLPEDGDRVPEHAFFSESGRAYWQRSRERFERHYLLAWYAYLFDLRQAYGWPENWS